METQHLPTPSQTETSQEPVKAQHGPTGKDRRHAARKRLAMRRGQYACIVPGGLDAAAFADASAGLIRVTPQGIFLYRGEK